MEQRLIIARSDKYTPLITWAIAKFKTPAELGYAIKIIEKVLETYSSDISYEHIPVKELLGGTG